MLMTLPISVTSPSIDYSRCKSKDSSSTPAFVISSIIILLGCCIGGLMQNGFLGMPCLFGKNERVNLSTGQGISGIMMNIIGYITTAAMNQPLTKKKV